MDEQYHTQLSVPADPKVIVVIPAYNEDLEQCLQSLGRCQAEPHKVSVIIVFNNAVSSDLQQKHAAQYKHWHNHLLENGIKVQAIAALALPPKQAGVGLARKIGMDAAFSCFAMHHCDGLIVCLDADCTVSENYLSELIAVEQSEVNGLSLYFEHPLENLNLKEKEQILRYEIWLRYYVQALRHIGYPFAFHTVGSSMAVRASVYGKIGGMNKKKAGEDFYFLHKLIPQGGFKDLSTVVVYPSPRVSARVPFGTGRAMGEMLAGKKEFNRVYSPHTFKLIKGFIAQDLEKVVNAVESTSNPIESAIHALGWHEDLSQLWARSSNPSSAKKNFKLWMNGFKMLKLVHWLRDNYFDDVGLLEAANTMLNLEFENHYELMLALREMDRSDKPYCI